MRSDDRNVVIVYNGEIFNHAELRQELEALGYSFRSRSDTEVVLNAYHAWGERCVNRFNGMFAFAAWNARRQQLFLARDRYGIKPLYYRHCGRTLMFASEAKSLLQHPGVTATLRPSALTEYFTFQNIFGDQTLFDGINLLPPGHTLHCQLGNTKPVLSSYWKGVFSEDSTIEYGEAVEEVRRLVKQAVTRQLRGDTRVGCYLSGGIDSAAIANACVGEVRELTTFTAGFDASRATGDAFATDERAAAAELSRHFNTTQHEIVITAAEMERVLPAIVWHLEDLRVGQCYPNYLVAELASRSVKVVLSGVGGDELFGGYPWRYGGHQPAGRDDGYLERQYEYWQRLVPDRAKPHFFQPWVYVESLAHPAEASFRTAMGRFPITSRNSGDDFLHRSLQFELHTFMHGLLIVEDKVSMAHGLETRVPFLDNDLVDFALRLPARFKVSSPAARRAHMTAVGTASHPERNGECGGKLVLRDALRGCLPPEQTQRTKRGFSGPDASWFRGESREYVRRLLSHPHARLNEYIQPRAVQDLLREHVEGKRNHRLLIWSLICFELWCGTFLDGALPVQNEVA